MKILSEKAVEERTRDSSLGENEDFERVGVLGGETDRGRKLVVKLVNVLVERSPVETSVGDVVEEVCSGLASQNEPRNELAHPQRRRSMRSELPSTLLA